MSNEDVAFLRLFGSIFAGVGSILAIAGIIIAVNTRTFVSQSISAQGTVIDVERRKSRDSDGSTSSSYYPVIRFITNSGEPIVFEANSGSNPPAYNKGQQVEIIYNPQPPVTG